jgi:osmotically inducible protein OsmC
MPTRSSEATWNGDLPSGHGTMALGSGAFEGSFSFQTRFEDEPGTNPEELIAAAHAGCFSMALSNLLAEAGHTPESVQTSADVRLEMVDGDPTITKITLNTEASVPGLDDDTFQKHAAAAKAGCPVSKVLSGADITLNATLQ